MLFLIVICRFPDHYWSYHESITVTDGDSIGPVIAETRSKVYKTSVLYLFILLKNYKIIEKAFYFIEKAFFLSRY